MRPIAWLSCPLFAAALACADLTPPVDYPDLPPENTSLDTSALRVGDLLYACGHWRGDTVPSDAAILTDIHFPRPTAADPADQPRDESLAAVRARGGEVLYRFAYPAARVRISPAGLVALMRSGDAHFAVTVPDQARYDWGVVVGFRRALEPADSALFLSHGGRIEYWWPFIHALFGDIPNRSLAALRARPDVEYVEANTVGCLAQN